MLHWYQQDDRLGARCRRNFGELLGNRDRELDSGRILGAVEILAPVLSLVEAVNRLGNPDHRGVLVKSRGCFRLGIPVVILQQRKRLRARQQFGEHSGGRTGELISVSLLAWRRKRGLLKNTDAELK